MDTFDERIEQWKSRLLDLSRRNRLLYFRPTKFSTIQVTSPGLQELFNALVVHDRCLRFPMAMAKGQPTALPLWEEGKGPEEEPAYRVKKGDLEVDLDPKELPRRLHRLQRDFRTFIVEQGVHTLFMALGFLHWREVESSDEELQAPIILVPVTLVKESDEKPHGLRPADEETTVNPTLVFKLKNDFSVSLPALPDDLDTFDVPRYLSRVAALVRRLGWDVSADAWLGRFSFEKLVMYEDLEDHRQEAREHEIVSALAGATESIQETRGWKEEDLDSVVFSEEVFPVLDADSSQMETLLRVRAGENLVVWGPPGTGKSQTIGNLIALSLRDGKRVLFVSEKMAALEVVDRRLREVGLGPAILEVHSHRANKRAVIEELGRTLFRERGGDLADASSKFEALRREVTQLNQYVKELHRPRDAQKRSAYQIVGQLASLDHVPYCDFTLPFGSAIDATDADEQQILAVLRELSAVPAVVDNYHDHPFRGWDVGDLSLDERNRIHDLLQAILEGTRRLHRDAERLAETIGVPAPASIADAEQFRDLAGLLVDTPPTTSEWFDADGSRLRDLRSVAEEGEAHQEAYLASRRALQDLCGLGVTDLPLEELKARFTSEYTGALRFLKPGYRRDMQILREAWRGPQNLSYKRGLKALDDALIYKHNAEWIQGNLPRLQKEFGEELITGLDTEWDRVGAAVDWAQTLSDRFRGDSLPASLIDAIQKRQGLRGLSAECERTLTEGLDSLGGYLQSLLHVYPAGSVAGDPIESAPFDSLLSWLDLRIARIHELDVWARFARATEKCSQIGLADFLGKVIQQRVTAEQLVPVFRKRLFMGWLADAGRQSPALADFNGTYREQIIESFRELDRRLMRESARLTLAKIQEMQPKPAAPLATDTSQMSVLMREIQKKRRHRPLRRLFSEIPTLLQHLKPCMLMSPLSVSSYLTKGSFHFDLVVFDEASQIPPQDAICSILRADRAVVAGDDKQLPPTTFFQVDLDSDDEEDETDEMPLDSILEQCAALIGSCFSDGRLRWHYRSRHEALIAFSNREFYEGSLITFPSPVVDDRSVRFEYVPGAVYDRGGSRTNRKEARRVAEMVVQHFEDFQQSRSLGVIALNEPQARAIEEELLRIRPSVPHLAPLFDENGDEPFFVKNLENVQGDERDHIIISIGYGPDAAGNMTLNFGPINRDGGERRLNVAITRAKWQTTVVSSFMPHELDLSRLTTGKQGVIKLQRYLEYAHRGEFAAEATGYGEAENDFEEAVRKALVDAGLSLDAQVGCSGFRIDLAVRHPDREGRYILGVECDGASYHSSRTARDRDRLRQEVLERLGWNLLRIWSLDWLRDPRGQTRRVVEMVERLRHQGDLGVIAPPRNPNEPGPGDTSRVQNGGREPGSAAGSVTCSEPEPIELPPYTEYRAPSKKWSNHFYEALDSSRHLTSVADDLGRVVESEGPIHKSAAARRVASVYGLARAGRKVRQVIELAIELECRRNGLRAAGEFLWPIGKFSVQPRRRINGREPPIEEVPIEEIAATMVLILQRHFGAPEEDLCTEAAHLLAYDRSGQRVQSRMRQTIKYLAAASVTTKVGDQLVLRDPERSLADLEATARRRGSLAFAASSPSSSEAQPKPAARPRARGTRASTGLVRATEPAGFPRNRTPASDSSRVVSRGTILAHLQEALRRGHAVRMAYASAQGQPRIREVDVYGVGENYFEGYCHLRKEVRTFKIGRIHWAVMSEKTFRRPDTYRPNRWVVSG